MLPLVWGLALELLSEDNHGWFHKQDRQEAIAAALKSSLQELETLLGPKMEDWKWGKLHTMHFFHPLTHRGEVFKLLDRDGEAVPGCGETVNMTAYYNGYDVTMGPNYRMVVDFGEDSPEIRTVHIPGQSGHPGSENYYDQLSAWASNKYHHLPLEPSVVEEEAKSHLTLIPDPKEKH